MNTFDHTQVVLAHEQSRTLRLLTEALADQQYHVAESCRTAACLVSHCQQHPPNLIITGAELPDGDGLTALAEISKNLAVPAVLVLPRKFPKPTATPPDACVMGYLFEPIQKPEVEAIAVLALKRYSQFKVLQDEVRSLKQTLAERKIIERAKGLLMKARGCDEDEAWKQLRRMATDSRNPLIDVARRILDEYANSAAGNG